MKPAGRWQKRGVMFVGLAFVLVLVAAGTIELEGANILTLIVLGAIGVLFIAGFHPSFNHATDGEEGEGARVRRPFGRGFLATLPQPLACHRYETTHPMQRRA